MPTMTNPSPRPLVLRGSGRSLGPGETAELSEVDAETPGLLPPTQPTVEQPPAGNAKTDVWAAYARDVVGIDVADDATRDQIQAAIAAHREES